MFGYCALVMLGKRLASRKKLSHFRRLISVGEYWVILWWIRLLPVKFQMSASCTWVACAWILPSYESYSSYLRQNKIISRFKPKNDSLFLDITNKELTWKSDSFRCFVRVMMERKLSGLMKVNFDWFICGLGVCFCRQKLGIKRLW